MLSRRSLLDNALRHLHNHQKIEDARVQETQGLVADYNSSLLRKSRSAVFIAVSWEMFGHIYLKCIILS